MRAKLIPIGGGSAIEITDDLHLVGRSRDCDIQFKIAPVSSVHCMLSRRGDRVLLRDLKSRNGCWVNGRRVERTALKDGDVVAIATSEFRISIVQEEAAAAAVEKSVVSAKSLRTEIASMNNHDLHLRDWKPGLEVFTDCTLVSRIAEGGFGEVWKADRKNFGEIALKRIPLTDPIRNERRALKAMRGLTHRYLIRIFGCRLRENVLVVAMELGDESLEDHFEYWRQQGQSGVPQKELLRHLRHIAESLDYLYYTRNLLHRDIKPANILLVKGSAKLGDFGLAKVLEHETDQHSGVGSFEYAPPEFFDSKMVASSDQFSLAATYCYLLCGQRPFPGPGMRQIIMQHLAGKPVLDGFPEPQQGVLRRALAKNPADRYPSCSHFLNALRRAVRWQS